MMNFNEVVSVNYTIECDFKFIALLCVEITFE